MSKSTGQHADVWAEMPIARANHERWQAVADAANKRASELGIAWRCTANDIGGIEGWGGCANQVAPRAAALHRQGIGIDDARKIRDAIKAAIIEAGREHKRCVREAREAEAGGNG